MNNVAGISSAASQRASDIKLKCEYLQELHGNDRGVVFVLQSSIARLWFRPNHQARLYWQTFACCSFPSPLSSLQVFLHSDTGAVKNLEQIKKTKQAQLKKLMDSSKKDDVLTFENLGVDYLRRSAAT